MKATQTNLRDFMGNADERMAIPVYQRVYAWTERQLGDWWNDIQDAARSDRPHFVGTVYYLLEEAGGARQLDIIDGQQRLSTCTLLLAALRDWLSANGRGVAGMSAEDLNATYLLAGSGQPANGPAPPDCKLTMSRADIPTMRYIVAKGQKPEDEEDFSEYVEGAYEYFSSRMQEDGFDPEELFRGLGLLSIVAVELEESDRPQAVFESLNSKGMSLTTLDLMRNLLMVGFSNDEKRRLNREYWRPIEDLYAEDPDPRYLAGAIKWWLGGANSGSPSNDYEIYARFKAKMRDASTGKKEETMRELLDRCKWFRGRIDSANGKDLRKLCDDWYTEKPKQLSNSNKIFGD